MECATTTRPYFELKAAVNQQLEAQKQKVKHLEESVARAKVTYSQAICNLETISDEIHRVNILFSGFFISCTNMMSNLELRLI